MVGSSILQTHSRTLKNGTSFYIREIRPDDKEKLQCALKKLSLSTRFFRFHSSISRLSGYQLQYLTEIDYYDHYALCAAVDENGSEEGIGVARYVRLTDDSNNPSSAPDSVLTVTTRRSAPERRSSSSTGGLVISVERLSVSAEFAITIADQYQNLGLGKVLFEALVEKARQNNIERFIGHVHSVNDRMFSLLKHYDYRTLSVNHNVHEVEIIL